VREVEEEEEEEACISANKI